MKVNKWIILPAIAGVITVGSVAMADDDVKKAKVETNAQVEHKGTEATGYLTKEKAIELALAKADGQVTEISLDEDDNRVHYDIEIKDDKYEYELDLDAITGEIFEFEKNRDDHAKAASGATTPSGKANPDSSKEQTAAKTSNLISEKEAIAIALKAAPGTLTEVELDDDHKYEIEIKDGKIKYELSINAKTGAIDEFEKEIDDND
ncbi:PepSY domain-containing protein [Mesobacillus subterraneus]|uniref:PepSY domain-containing protein n=1 Tax=Mesobacillus subterraneus TaxID=285983 RepID=A0A3R9EG17_9BACI|nr:PepSY domain-containing protein [Mesobacillus subterraneus]RSD29547.1 hypothetical protein EJA10_00100 [Mesobacillus subterraneus]